MKLHKIADLYVGIEYKYSIMKAQAPKYETSDKPEIVDIAVWSNDDTISKLKTDKPMLTVDECEYLITGANFYDCLIGFDGLMLHASAVAYKNGAYLFSADPGTGKSTHTQLWLKAFGKEARILNDDKPAIRYEDGKLYAYGTPFSGKHDLSANKRAEVAGICFLERALENSIEQISPKQSVHLMLEQTIRSNEIEFMDKLLFVMDKLLTSVKVYKLHCNMDISAARLAYETMSNTGE